MPFHTIDGTLKQKRVNAARQLLKGLCFGRFSQSHLGDLLVSGVDEAQTCRVGSKTYKNANVATALQYIF